MHKEEKDEPVIVYPRCPRCQGELSGEMIRSLWATYTNSLRKTHKGGDGKPGKPRPRKKSVS